MPNRKAYPMTKHTARFLLLILFAAPVTIAGLLVKVRGESGHPLASDTDKMYPLYAVYGEIAILMAFIFGAMALVFGLCFLIATAFPER